MEHLKRLNSPHPHYPTTRHKTEHNKDVQNQNKSDTIVDNASSTKSNTDQVADNVDNASSKDSATNDENQQMKK